MNKLYDKITFHNETTPALNETNLNAMSKAIDDIDDRVIELGADVLEKVPEIIEIFEDVEELSENPPYIGQNGNWYVWDTDTGEYVDSGIDASITVEIADVTALAPDASPYVTNTGTNTDPIFHLFIPRGQTGDTYTLDIHEDFDLIHGNNKITGTLYKNGAANTTQVYLDVTYYNSDGSVDYIGGTGNITSAINTDDLPTNTSGARALFRVYNNSQKQKCLASAELLFGETGATGQTGQTGATGATPNITASATIDANTGTPAVTVTKTGTAENPALAFAFSNLKGVDGTVPITKYTQTLSAGSTSVTFNNVTTTANSIVEVATSVSGLEYNAISNSGNSYTVTFDAQSSAVTVYLLVTEVA